MNTIIKSIVAAAVFSVVSAGSAFAFVPTNASVLNDIRNAHVHSPSISVNVVDGIVTLTGDVEDGIEKAQAYNAVRNSEGVVGVINLITTN